jgi:hypothetical protein
MPVASPQWREQRVRTEGEGAGEACSATALENFAATLIESGLEAHGIATAPPRVVGGHRAIQLGGLITVYQRCFSANRSSQCSIRIG